MKAFCEPSIMNHIPSWEECIVTSLVIKSVGTQKLPLPRSMVCSDGSVGIPQNMMLVSMVQRNSEKQQETRCTRVKLLFGGRLITENQM